MAADAWDGAKTFANHTEVEYSGHKKKAHAVAWSNDGRKLASASLDQTARVWDIEKHKSGKEIELKGHKQSVLQICWDPKHPDILASCSSDKTVKIWDIRSGKAHSITTEGENINLAWSPNGKHIGVGSKSDIISFIDTRKYKVVRTQDFPTEVNEFMWDKTGEFLFVTEQHGIVEVYGYNSMELVHTLNSHSNHCYCLEFDNNDRYMAVGSADSLVTLWDLEDFVCVKTFDKQEWPVRAVSFSAGAEYIAAGSEDPFIGVYHVESGELVHQIPTRGAINQIDWHPTRDILAFAGDSQYKDDGLLYVWGPRT